MQARTLRATAGIAFVLLAASGIVPAPAAAGTVRAVTYFHPERQHYVVAADPAEIAARDDGTRPGWWRTGLRYLVSDTAEPGLVPVCRFRAAAFGEPAPHLLTASEAECEALKASDAWRYEGIAFHALPPDEDGACDGMAVRRYYNGGRGGAPNHAYSPHASHGADLVDAGYVDEGVAFCVPTSHREAYRHVADLAGTRWEIVESPGGKQRATPEHVQFGDVVSRDAGEAFASIGAFDVDFAIHPRVAKASAALAGWDPVSYAYTAVAASAGNKAAGPTDVHQLDRADGPVMRACRHALHETELAFQPVLWSPCTPITWIRR
jgi:hypothetical protein